MRSMKMVTVLFAAVLFTSGCATTGDATDNDPLEGVNRAVHNFNDALDDTLLRPVAEGYVKVTTPGIRRTVTNFFANAAYPNVILNDFLQGKVLQGFEDIMRFTINTTFGLGGLFDVATDMELPANDEDFGQTLGVWGLGEVAYLELPLFGPNSVRDVPDIPISRAANLLSLASSSVTWPLTILDVVNTRANLASAVAVRDRSALDPYVFTREAYRQRREFLIYDGDPPDEEFDRLEEDTTDR